MTLPRASTSMLRDLIDSFLGIKALTGEEMSQRELSMTHFVAMRIIESHHGCTMSQLTEGLVVTHGASTGIIDRLAKLELVERSQSPQDRRIVQVALTPKGQALIADVISGAAARFDQILSKFDTISQEQLAQGLALLADAFRSTPPSSDGENAHAASR